MSMLSDAGADDRRPRRFQGAGEVQRLPARNCTIRLLGAVRGRWLNPRPRPGSGRGAEHGTSVESIDMAEDASYFRRW